MGIGLMGAVPILPQCATDALLSTIVSSVLASFDPAAPLEVPLQVPVALKITEIGGDEDESLVTLPGLVRESTRVLQGLTNPLLLDGAIPAAILRRAQGLVLMTHVRAGFALGATMGSGIMIRRLANNVWSGPVSVGTAGVSFGPQLGVRKTDTLLCLMSEHSIEVFERAIDGFAQLKLGTTIAVAAGPIGRDASIDARAGEGGVTACLAYSQSQGAYLGVSLEGETLTGRREDNEEYYYAEGITAGDVLHGRIAPPTDPDVVALYQVLAELSGSRPPAAHLQAAATEEKPLW